MDVVPRDAAGRAEEMGSERHPSFGRRVVGDPDREAAGPKLRRARDLEDHAAPPIDLTDDDGLAEERVVPDDPLRLRRPGSARARRLRLPSADVNGPAATTLAAAASTIAAAIRLCRLIHALLGCCRVSRMPPFVVVFARGSPPA